MLTMKQARKAYAGREMVSPAFVDKESGRRHPRVNRRAVRTQSFKAWARANCGEPTLSPKLAHIFASAAAAAA